MMVFFYLAGLGVLGGLIYRDFQSDKGQHIRAKWLHAILLIILMADNLRSITRFLWIVRDLPVYIEWIQSGEGIRDLVDGLVTVMVAVCSLVVFGLGARMSRRKDTARKYLLVAIPIVIGLNVLNMWLIYTRIPSLIGPLSQIGLARAIGASIFHVGFYTATWFAYRSPMMGRFFDKDLDVISPNIQSLEEMIGEIGDANSEHKGEDQPSTTGS